MNKQQNKVVTLFSNGGVSLSMLAGCAGACRAGHFSAGGITGNHNFMFQNLNNDVVADHVEAWILANLK